MGKITVQELFKKCDWGNIEKEYCNLIKSETITDLSLQDLEDVYESIIKIEPFNKENWILVPAYEEDLNFVLQKPNDSNKYLPQYAFFEEWAGFYVSDKLLQLWEPEKLAAYILKEIVYDLDLQESLQNFTDSFWEGED
jgi:hypothetical protein